MLFLTPSEPHPLRKPQTNNPLARWRLARGPKYFLCGSQRLIRVCRFLPSALALPKPLSSPLFTFLGGEGLLRTSSQDHIGCLLDRRPRARFAKAQARIDEAAIIFLRGGAGEKIGRFLLWAVHSYQDKWADVSCRAHQYVERKIYCKSAAKLV